MKPRGRPKKRRVIENNPRINQFSPRGKPGRPDETVLNTDEFEAIRLADFNNLSQKEAAKSMKISQQTFSRILRKAHITIAQAIVKGNIIKIQECDYTINSKINSAVKKQIETRESEAWHKINFPRNKKVTQ